MGNRAPSRAPGRVAPHAASSGEGPTTRLPVVNSHHNGNDVQPWEGVGAQRRHYTGSSGTAILRVTWRDQGWGNQKGTLFYRHLESPESSLMTPWRSLSAHAPPTISSLAPHQWTTETFSIPVDGSGFLGAYFIQLGYRVGGGGGHELHIKEATLTMPSTLPMRRPEQDQEPAAEEHYAAVPSPTSRTKKQPHPLLPQQEEPLREPQRPRLGMPRGAKRAPPNAATLLRLEAACPGE